MLASVYYRLSASERPKLDHSRPAPRVQRRPADSLPRAKARLATCKTCEHARYASGASCALIEAAVADGRIPRGCGGCDGHPVRRAFMRCLLDMQPHPRPDLCTWT